MSSTYKGRGIVLHTIKYGDSGLVAWVLTDVGGRRSFMVQGVRSSRGRGNKAALLQPMFLIEFEGYSPPRAEMHRFRELHAAVVLRSVPFDARKSTVALFMAELLYRLVREVEADSPLFDFVWEAVSSLDSMDEASAVANFHLWFMVGLARYLGFFPGNEWTPGSWFDIREGLFVAIEPRGGAFSLENSALLGRLMDIPVSGAAIPAPSVIPSPSVIPAPAFIPNAGEGSALSHSLSALALNRERRAGFMNSMLAYFGWHLDAVRDIRSVDILREVF
jgi:DNA repair protein RecO (recombination protein O)